MEKNVMSQSVIPFLDQTILITPLGNTPGYFRPLLSL